MIVPRGRVRVHLEFSDPRLDHMIYSTQIRLTHLLHLKYANGQPRSVCLVRDFLWEGDSLLARDASTSMLRI